MSIPILCKFAGHALDRRRVRHDGEDFRGRCKRCDEPMIKIIDEWYEYSSELHDTPGFGSRLGLLPFQPK